MWIPMMVLINVPTGDQEIKMNIIIDQRKFLSFIRQAKHALIDLNFFCN